MATRFYLPATAATTPITPTPDAGWEDTSIFARAMMSTSKIGDAITTVSFTDSDVTEKDILFRQYISAELTAGQTFTGAADGADLVIRAKEATTGGNLFVSYGLRVLNGTTVNKTLYSVITTNRDNTEASATALTNRASATITFDAGNYTTVSGDRLVFEIGMGGDPSGGGSPDHDSDMSFGDSSGSDLVLNDTGTAADNPYLELAVTLTFVAPTLALTGTVTTATETDIVAGGKTVILTLTDASWISAALFNAQRQNIINGMDSAQAEAGGWDAKVKALQGVAGVVRTSDSVVTITLDAQAAYSITANETITVTIPASAISGGVGSVASPTFTITNVSAATENQEWVTRLPREKSRSPVWQAY